MKSGILLVLLVVAWCNFVKNENILYVSLTCSASHNFWDQRLALALRNRGHNITFLTTYSFQDDTNFTTVILEGMHKELNTDFNFEILAYISPWELVTSFFTWLEKQVELFIEAKIFQKYNTLFENKQKFDLIIMDCISGHLAYPLIEQLNFPPVIAVSHVGILPHFINYFGHNLESSYIPFVTLPFSNEMTFLDRTKNFIYSISWLYYRQYVTMPKVWKNIQEHIGTNSYSFQEIEKNFSLMFVATDSIFDYPRSLPPTIIPVAGLHIKKQNKLPKDLQYILDNSNKGAILVSFGTNLLIKNINEDKKQVLFKVFRQLKETVILKYEDNITGLPNNIISRKWIPQNDILAHPNLKLFISHGGSQSTYEAIQNGIPIISIPFFFDQIVNSYKIKKRKIGRTLEYKSLTFDSFYQTIKEVLNEPLYKSNAVKLSKLFKDQPQDPLSRAVWWTEYTIRNKGAQHLHPSSRDMPFYQTYLIDVILFLFFILLIGIWLLKLLCIKLWNLHNFNFVNHTQKKNL